jgi:hypothetical protein
MQAGLIIGALDLLKLENYRLFVFLHPEKRKISND